MTANKYKKLRVITKDDETKKNSWPSFKRMTQKKQDSYPGDIQANDTSTWVTLQSLIDHTVSRMFELDSIKNMLNEVLIREECDDLEVVSLNMLFKAGADGAGGFNTFKHR